MLVAPKDASAVMVESLVGHCRHDGLTWLQHHHARRATLASADASLLLVAEVARSLKLHRSAGRCKRNISKMMAAKSWVDETEASTREPADSEA